MKKYYLANSHEKARKIIEFKGSESTALVRDILISEIMTLYENNIQPITITNQRLSKEELQKNYHGYNYLPFTKESSFYCMWKIILKNKLKAKICKVQDNYN